MSTATASMLWVHDEMLRPDVLRDGEPACFVFDERWLRDERISFKRIVFMAECLEEMPGVEVRRGDVVNELSAFAASRGITTIRTQSSPLPRIGKQLDALSPRFVIDAFTEPAFVALTGPVDLKRFSRYWNRARDQAFIRTCGKSEGLLFDA